MISFARPGGEGGPFLPQAANASISDADSISAGHTLRLFTNDLVNPGIQIATAMIAYILVGLAYAKQKMAKPITHSLTTLLTAIRGLNQRTTSSKGQMRFLAEAAGL